MSFCRNSESAGGSASKCICSLKFDQFDPFPHMTQKVCYIKRKNSVDQVDSEIHSEILSQLKSLVEIIFISPNNNDVFDQEVGGAVG